MYMLHDIKFDHLHILRGCSMTACTGYPLYEVGPMTRTVHIVTEPSSPKALISTSPTTHLRQSEYLRTILATDPGMLKSSFRSPTDCNRLSVRAFQMSQVNIALITRSFAAAHLTTYLRAWPSHPTVKEVLSYPLSCGTGLSTSSPAIFIQARGVTSLHAAWSAGPS